MAEELSGQAEQLASSAAFFKLDTSGSANAGGSPQRGATSRAKSGAKSEAAPKPSSAAALPEPQKGVERGGASHKSTAIAVAPPTGASDSDFEEF